MNGENYINDTERLKNQITSLEQGVQNLYAEKKALETYNAKLEGDLVFMHGYVAQMRQRLILRLYNKYLKLRGREEL